MGRVLHFEIAVDEVERASKFYRTVFGWQISEAMPDEYWLIKTGADNQDGINGALMKRQKPMASGDANAYVCTIGIHDLAESRQKVAAAGGKLVTDIMPVPGIGSFSYCLDTEGNRFGLLEPTA